MKYNDYDRLQWWRGALETVYGLRESLDAASLCVAAYALRVT
jgi:hypothetical protein